MTDDPKTTRDPDALDEYLSRFGKPPAPLIKGAFTPMEEAAFKRLGKRIRVVCFVVFTAGLVAFGIANGVGLFYYPLVLVISLIGVLGGTWIGATLSRFMLTRVGRRRRLGGGDNEDAAVGEL